MNIIQAAQSLTQYLGETDADYQEATSHRQLTKLTRGAGEVINTTLTEGQTTDLYYAFGEVSDAMSAASWNHEKNIPWDDHWSLVIQSHVHTYAAELTRILNTVGYEGTILADTLDDILKPSELANQ